MIQGNRLQEPDRADRHHHLRQQGRVFHVVGALAEFECDLIRERAQAELARRLYEGGQTDIDAICRTLGISWVTLYRTLKQPSVDPATTS